MYAGKRILQSGAGYGHTVMHHGHQIGADYGPPRKLRRSHARSVHACMTAGRDISQHGGKS